MVQPGRFSRRGFPGIVAAAGIAFAAALIGPAAAQQGAADPGPAASILVLNQERLIARSLYGQRIQRELEAASSALSAENRRIETRLTAEELDLTEMRDTLPPADFRVMADEFDTRVEAIRAAQEAKARDISEQADAAQTQFFELAAPILLEIVRERGAAVLMDSRAVLLSADSVDITETAIAAIDATLGDGGEDPIIDVEIALPDAPADGGTDGSQPVVVEDR
ncbi:OmpH family outer membrane protein [Roseibacterium sp. SDUM158016]|uniref:OmpH family outer membrane protein n=1 Tax=Roseicyclus sediminis TaxID=2980997 RepID=UPI0021CF340F|nr:OmpH family outer membrane protein [Roseibacterium sp. SDUM158016]MCU4654554.1 OmpH family outer membrane protein [Roseibacterium sp. SDUM158016]